MRETVFHVRLTDVEREKLDAVAESQGMRNAATWIRTMIHAAFAEAVGKSLTPTHPLAGRDMAGGPTGREAGHG